MFVVSELIVEECCFYAFPKAVPIQRLKPPLISFRQRIEECLTLRNDRLPESR